MEGNKAEEEPKGEKKKKKEASEETKENKKAEESKKTPELVSTPPPQEIILRVFMDCEGCAQKVGRCLKGFEGVEDVQTDCKTHKVVVKGEFADPMKVLERVQKKSHRQVELISPIPKPSPPEEKNRKEKEVPKPKEKKEVPQVITVILNVHMHCEACAQEIKGGILKMKGVDNVELDLKSSQVTVKGVFDPTILMNYIHKRTGKHVVIVKRAPEKKERAKGKKKKDDDEGGDKVGEGKKDGGSEVAEATTSLAVERCTKVANVVEPRKNEFYYNYPQHHHIYQYPQRFEVPIYAPQIFSDENPNACSVM